VHVRSDVDESRRNLHGGGPGSDDGHPLPRKASKHAVRAAVSHSLTEAAQFRRNVCEVGDANCEDDTPSGEDVIVAKRQ
jgi:hypothetical protein